MNFETFMESTKWTFSNDDIVVVEVPLKRGGPRVVRIRSSRYDTPKGGWKESDFQQMAASQVDKFLITGAAVITHVIPCK